MEMAQLQNCNKKILCNLLPDHVAMHVMDNYNKKNNMVRKLIVNFPQWNIIQFQIILSCLLLHLSIC